MNKAQAKKAVLASLLDHFTAIEDVVGAAMQHHDDHITDEEKRDDPELYARLVAENERRVTEAAWLVLHERAPMTRLPEVTTRRAKGRTEYAVQRRRPESFTWRNVEVVGSESLARELLAQVATDGSEYRILRMTPNRMTKIPTMPRGQR